MATNHPLAVGGASRSGRDTPILRLATKETDPGGRHRFSFAGHLLAEEDDIRSGVVYSILKNAWRPKGGLEVHEQSKNTYIFILSDEKEKDRILQESPWFVKGSHIVLKEWPISQRFDELVFSCSEFWVQVHGLPKGCMTLENVQLIGSLFPRLISWDQSTLGGLESFLHLRVEIDVQAPLLSGFQFQQLGEDIWNAEFKYEKLGDFCYTCGRLGHTKKSCEDSRWKADEGIHVPQPKTKYGPHLRVAAYSPRRHYGSIREGKKSLQTYEVNPAQVEVDKQEAGLLIMPTKPVEHKTLATEREIPEVGSAEQTDEGRVEQASPILISSTLNEQDLQSSSNIITTLTTGLAPSFSHAT
ncbi:hypothetical protein SLA2020_341210 [Shorea laevis]